MAFMKFNRPNSPFLSTSLNPLASVLLAIVLTPFATTFALAQLPQPSSLLARESNPATRPSLRSTNVWKMVLGQAPTPAPWKITPCQGTAPLLCVNYAGKLVGTVEMGVHLLDSRADFKKALKNAGFPPVLSTSRIPRIAIASLSRSKTGYLTTTPSSKKTARQRTAIRLCLPLQPRRLYQ